MVQIFLGGGGEPKIFSGNRGRVIPPVAVHAAACETSSLLSSRPLFVLFFFPVASLFISPRAAHTRRPCAELEQNMCSNLFLPLNDSHRQAQHQPPCRLTLKVRL